MQTVVFLTGGRQSGVTTKLLTMMLEYTRQNKKVMFLTRSEDAQDRYRQNLSGLIGAPIDSDLFEFCVFEETDGRKSALQEKSLRDNIATKKILDNEKPSAVDNWTFIPLTISEHVKAVFINLDSADLLDRVAVLRNVDRHPDVDFYIGTSQDPIF